MKKSFKIAGIVLVSLLVLLIVLPLAFQGKIKTIATEQINKMLNAQVSFDRLSISLLRNFPNASITLKDLDVTNLEPFAGDTLAHVGEFTAAVNLWSLLGEQIKVNKIILKNTSAYAHVDTAGRANWDIVKPSTDTTATSEQDTSAAAFNINIKQLILKDIDLKYHDEKSGMFALADDLDLKLSGNLGAEHTTLKLESQIDEFTFKQGVIPYLKKAEIYAKVNVDADLKNNIFELQDNSLRLNAIETSLSGRVALLPENAVDLDLTLNTNKIGLKEILSLIPAVYAKEFDKLKATADISLSAFAKGTLKGDILPAFEAKLDITNGNIQYEGLPKSIDNLTLKASATNPGGTADATVAKIEPLSFGIAGETFTLTATVATPISDPAIKAEAKGGLNLGVINEVFPLDDMNLSGRIQADFGVAGRLSMLESGNYTAFDAHGTLALSNMTLIMKDLPKIEIKKSVFTFSPKYLQLSETRVNLGKSDVSADCRFDNYLAFVLKGGLLKGSLNVKSDLLDINELTAGMTDDDSETSKTDTTASAPMKVIEVPKSIGVTMNANLNRVVYDKITLEKVHGGVTVKAGTLDMNDLSMNVFGGNVVSNAAYSTASGIKAPTVKGAFKINNLSFEQSFNSLEAVQQFAPVFASLKGTYSGSLNLDMVLDSTMSPVLKQVNGSGKLSTHDLNLANVKAVSAIAAVLKNDKFSNFTVKDLNLSFTIKEGVIETSPFDLKFGNVNINVSGSTSLDQTIDYSGKVTLPISGRNVTLPLTVTGTFDSPKVGLDTKALIGNAVNEAKDKVVGKLEEKLGISLTDAKKQKEELVAAAEKAGQKLVEEAQKQADALVEKAGGKTLAKIAAKTAGDKLVKEAQKQADQLKATAEAEGDKLIEKAETKKE